MLVIFKHIKAMKLSLYELETALCLWGVKVIYKTAA